MAKHPVGKKVKTTKTTKRRLKKTVRRKASVTDPVRRKKAPTRRKASVSTSVKKSGVRKRRKK